MEDLLVPLGGTIAGIALGVFTLSGGMRLRPAESITPVPPEQQSRLSNPIQPQQPSQTNTMASIPQTPIAKASQPETKDIPIYSNSESAKEALTARLGELPPILKENIRQIQVYPGRSPDEAHFGFSIAAQAVCETGTIEVYRDADGLNGTLLPHEAAHLLACKISGDSAAEPPGYADILKQEGPVSEYGRQGGVPEDFADAIAIKVQGGQLSPKRNKYITRVLTGAH